MDGEPKEPPVVAGGGATGTQQTAATALLRDLAAALHWSSMPSPIIEARLRAVARTLGVKADIFVLQGFLAIESTEGRSERVELRRIDFDAHWNVNRLHALVDLCTSLANGARDVTRGRAELERILAQEPLYPKALVVGAYGVYGAAVAARVGGGWREVLAGIGIGVVAGAIHFGANRCRTVDLQQSFFGALLGALAGGLLTFVLRPLDLGRSLFGGVSLLVPAMVLVIGTYELANDALESGVARMAYGLMRFLMLAFGLAVSLRLFAAVAPLPSHVSAAPLPRPLVFLLIALGGAALTACLQGRKADLPWMVLAALVAFGAQELTRVFFGDRGSPLLAALILGLAAYLYGRMTGKIPATFLIPGFLQIAPGFLGTQAVFDLLGGHATAWANPARFFDVFLTALQLVTGLLIADLLVGRRVDERLQGLRVSAW